VDRVPLNRMEQKKLKDSSNGEELKQQVMARQAVIAISKR